MATQHPIWTLTKKIDTPQNISAVLDTNETALVSHKDGKDIFTLTNQRILLSDSQGLFGSEHTLYVFPVSKIEAYSLQQANLQKNTLTIDTWNDQYIFKLDHSIDPNELLKLLAQAMAR